MRLERGGMVRFVFRRDPGCIGDPAVGVEVWVEGERARGIRTPFGAIRE